MNVADARLLMGEIMIRTSIYNIIRRILTLILAFLVMAVGFYAGEDVNAAEVGQTPFQIDFIDVGQGDSALVQCDGHYMLVDGGNSDQSSLLYSYLKARNISYLDVMVATHGDADHIGGLSGALNYANVGVAYCPVTDYDTKTFRSFVKYLGNQGKCITVPNAGDTFMIGSAVVTVVGPRTKSSSGDNNSSIMLRIEYGNTFFMLTGDAEYEEETSVLNSGQPLQSTVLKVAHHGSAGSTGYRFLKEVSPQYAVISVGKNNQYGHPTEEVLSRLRDADVMTYRTDMQGDIICVSDGNSVTFSVKKNADADTLTGAGPGQNFQKAESKGHNAENTRQIIESTGQDDVGAGDIAGAAVAGTIALQTAETERGIVSEDTGVGIQDNMGVTSSYILNKNTKKFHIPTCASVSDMKEKNKIYFEGSRQDAIDQGYVPCKRCNP